MEKEVVKRHQQAHSNTTITSNNSSSLRERKIIGDGLIRAPQSTGFVLKWGSRKRLRCMKIQVKDAAAPILRTTARVDRRVVRSDNNNGGSDGNHSNRGHFNLRQRPASPVQRILRNSEGMKGQQNYQHNHYQSNQDQDHRGVMNRTPSSSPEKGGSSGGEVVDWPSKFVIALTNKEKEEDFMAIKGSKLPQRPKKRAKFVQRTLNLMSPGGWLCDLTLERYEVREKKISKKRPRGLKAMGNYIDSDSE